jgi:general secretion pathway protein B
MSLILDALNRAERERKKTQDIPDLQTVHEPLPVATTPSSGRNPILFALGLMVIGLMVTMIYLFARAPAAPSPVTAPFNGAVNNATRVSPEPSAAAPAAAGVVNSQRKLPVTEANPAPGARNVVADGSTESADLNALYASAHAEDKPLDPVDSLYVATPERENPAGVRRETVAALPPVAVRNYESLIDIPDIGDLPWGFRQEIPSINYIRHNFDGEGANSLVLNGKAYYAGNTLAPDLMLEEIYVDGAIFQFKQIKFKLRALNSWVNM